MSPEPGPGGDPEATASTRTEFESEDAETAEPRPRRRIGLGRRIEALPAWVFVLLLVTVAVVVVAGFLATRRHVAPDGTDCGGVMVPNGFDSPEYTRAGCSDVLSEHAPLALALAGLAVVLVVASAVTLIVRGWNRREPPPWPGS